MGNDNLDRGSIVSYFPEGQMNKTPRKLNNLRFGSFKKAVELDAEIWSFCHAGHADVWPYKTKVPGSPARIYMRFDKVAPDGCGAYLEKLGKERSDFKFLAEHCQETLQGFVDELYAQYDAAKGNKKFEKAD